MNKFLEWIKRNQKQNIKEKIPLYIECKDKRFKYYIKKDIIKIVKTCTEETDYLIEIHYSHNYDVLIFQNEKERDEEYLRIIYQMR